MAHQPSCATSLLLSFFDEAEYLVHVGYAAINEHEHELLVNNMEKPYGCGAWTISMRGYGRNRYYVVFKSNELKDIL